MNKEPIVSIITVCFNSAKTIRDTIESVINQTYQNIEYIIIDGGSTDGTIDIIKEYEPYITKWVSEPDKGIYDAMNKGIGMATGDLIGILNSDDWYSNDAIELVLRVWVNHPEADIFHADVVMVNAASKKPIKRITCSKDIIPQPIMFVKHDVYRNMGKFDTRFKIAADTDFMRRVMPYIKKAYINQVLYFMRDAGISNTQYYLAGKELFIIRKRCGMNIILNLIIMLRECYGSYFRLFLEKIGLKRVVYYYQKRKTSKYVIYLE